MSGLPEPDMTANRINELKTEIESLSLTSFGQQVVYNLSRQEFEKLDNEFKKSVRPRPGLQGERDKEETKMNVAKENWAKADRDQRDLTTELVDLIVQSEINKSLKSIEGFSKDTHCLNVKSGNINKVMLVLAALMLIATGFNIWLANKDRIITVEQPKVQVEHDPIVIEHNYPEPIEESEAE